MTQLVLPIRLADHAVFSSFYDDGNESLVATLSELARGASDGHGCWLWGAAATGKTHLLQAVCDRAGDRSVYIPLATFATAGPERRGTSSPEGSAAVSRLPISRPR